MVFSFFKKNIKSLSISVFSLSFIILFLFATLSASPVYGQTPQSTSTSPSINQITQQVMDYINQTSSSNSLFDNYNPPTDPDILELPTQYQQSPIIITSTPEIPGPNENVRVKIESYATDLNRAQIIWTVNGKIIKKGFGEKEFDYKVGKMGTVTTLTVTVESIEGNTTSKTLKVAPAEIDLVWEATTYVPPFYKGRALPSYQSPIKVSAIPNMIQNGKTVLPQNMVFKWYRDFEVVDKSSGFGKSTFYVSDNIPIDPVTITVEASSVDGLVRATKSITLQQVAPRVLVYEKNPLRGIEYQKALFNISLTGQEISFAAVPYFFSTKNKQTGLDYTWSINGNKIAAQKAPVATFGNKNGATGNASTKVEVKHVQNVFQLGSAQTEVSLLEQAQDNTQF